MNERPDTGHSLFSSQIRLLPIRRHQISHDMSVSNHERIRKVRKFNFVFQLRLIPSNMQHWWRQNGGFFVNATTSVRYGLWICPSVRPNVCLSTCPWVYEYDEIKNTSYFFVDLHCGTALFLYALDESEITTSRKGFHLCMFRMITPEEYLNKQTHIQIHSKYPTRKEGESRVEENGNISWKTWKLMNSMQTWPTELVVRRRRPTNALI